MSPSSSLPSSLFCCFYSWIRHSLCCRPPPPPIWVFAVWTRSEHSKLSLSKLGCGVEPPLPIRAQQGSSKGLLAPLLSSASVKPGCVTGFLGTSASPLRARPAGAHRRLESVGLFLAPPAPNPCGNQQALKGKTVILQGSGLESKRSSGGREDMQTPYVIFKKQEGERHPVSQLIPGLSTVK